MAVKSIIKRNIKEIEIDKNDFLQFSESDLNFHLNRLANNANMDLATFKNICISAILGLLKYVSANFFKQLYR